MRPTGNDEGMMSEYRDCLRKYSIVGKTDPNLPNSLAFRNVKRRRYDENIQSSDLTTGRRQFIVLTG